jgi:2-dehydro-3-deoxyphosphogluconate aldolase/(4S)-4-hydroxy-2-oxoglutarate aldolase
MAWSTREEIVRFLNNEKIIAIIRVDRGGRTLQRVVEALADGGIRCIEITLTTPGALEALETAAKRYQDNHMCLGAGTILNAEDARRAIDAGAQYLVSPILEPAVIATAHQHAKAALPGAYTPNEIWAAWQAGGDLIKVFPAIVGGLEFIKALRAPLPQIPLVPTGGVDLDNLPDFLRAGAAAVGIGQHLVPKGLLAAEDYRGITALARQYATAAASINTNA